MKAQIEWENNAAKMTIKAETGPECVALKYWTDHFDHCSDDKDESILMTIIKTGIDGKVRLSDVGIFYGNKDKDKS